MAVNDQIPAPTLHFKKGDHVTINVYNHLDQDTAIHWHGMIVPWQMDGVEGISQRGIPPGGVFHYQFTLRQSGTYWYHAHAGLQEQQGLYGAFLIDPPKTSPYKYNKDYVLVLSDWSNTYPDQILANLKKEGDYYSPNFPLQPSLARFIHDYRKASKTERIQLIDDYKMMQQMRMSIYDISDVAYDAFLLNGHSKSNPWTAPVKVGDIVRLRFIGAGGSTIFHIKIPNTTMQMVHVEGNDVKPYAINDFTIAPGETYDVLVKIQKNTPYIIYAESRDTVGAAFGSLVTAPNQVVNYQKVTPFPEPLPVTREMMSMMMGNMGNMGNMGHGSPSMNMPMKINSSSHSMGMMNMDSKNSDKTMKSMSPNIKTHHGIESHVDHHSMSNSMKMDPGMKMDGNMPMDHSMQMNDHDTGSMSKTLMVNMRSHHAKHSGMSDNMQMGSSMKMDHTMDMSMPTEPSIISDKMSAPSESAYTTSTGTKYQNLIAAVKTNDPNKPVSKIIKMELFGYMDRYIWFINGVPGYIAKPIILEPSKRYRFIFINTSMMHHPMHIHGHWLIFRKGNGAYDPLLHTIDVPPGATITADVDTDASGQWFFHCHLLYHMMTGMSREFQYSTLIEITKGEAKPQDVVKQTPYHNRPIVRIDEVRPIDAHLVKHPMAHPAGLWLSTFLDVGADPFHNAQRLTYKGLYGPDYNKLELFMNDAEMKKGIVENADMDIFYWHLLDQFWAIKGGANYTYRPAQTPYWQPGIGLEGLMPYFIDTNVRGYYYSGSAKLDIELSRDTQITNNFFIRAGIRSILASKTVSQAEIGSGLNQMRYIIRPYYRLMPGLNIFAEYEHEKDYGAFRNLQVDTGKSAVQNTLTLGLSILF
jgi:FtsP/CotA-like multicopper oxidase with cupredoxin domain